MTPRAAKPALLEELPRTGHLVLEASAGTGKTFALEHALTDLVLGGLPLGQALVVTFSEKAAAELRRRVRATLEDLLAGGQPCGPDRPHWLLGPAERARLAQALVDFPQAPIHTIHGFCRRILLEQAFPARRLLRQEVIEKRAGFAEGFRALVRRQLALPGSPARVELEAWLRSGRDTAELEQLLYDVLSARGEVRPALDEGQARAALSELVSALEQAGGVAGACARVAPARLASTGAAVCRRLERLDPLLHTWRSTSSWVELTLAWKALEFDYLFETKTVIEARPKLTAIEAILGALEGLRRALAPFEATVAQVLLEPIRGGLARRKAARGHLDFDDMLQQMRDALRGPEGARLRDGLRQRFRIALIDEFQDTDEVQWEVFASAFLGAGEDHRLWVVGDPKQAIYAFRGADVQAYLAARRELTERQAAAQLPLRGHYRSTAPLLAALERLFAPGDSPVFTGEIQPGAPLVAARADEPEPLDPAGRGPVHLFQFARAGGDYLADEVRDLLGRAIAREARRLVLEDRVQVPERGQLRPLEWRDLFVLTGAGWEGKQVADHLRAAGVPVAFYKQDGLFQRDELKHLVTLLEALDDPRDTARRQRVLASPWFGLELGDVAGARELPGDDPLLRRLLEWRQLAEDGQLERLFRRALDQSGLLRRELMFGSDERALTNYLHLVELLLEEAGRGTRSPAGLAATLRRWQAESERRGGERGDLQRLEGEADAVQVLTFHKSKGLEAEVVFLFGGITTPRPNVVQPGHERPEEERPPLPGSVALHLGGRRVVHVGELSDAAAAALDREQREERQRVAYVAATRARARLYLPAFVRQGRAWSFRHLGGIQGELAARVASLAGVGEQAPAPGFTRQPVEEAALGSSAPPRATAPTSRWRPPAALLQPLGPGPGELAGLRARHAGRELTSYTRLKALELDGQPLEGPGDAPDPPAAAVAALGGQDLPGGTRVGSFLHRALELMPLAAAGRAPDLEDWVREPEVALAFRRAGERWPLAPEHVAAAQRLLWDALRTPLQLGDAHLPGLWSLTDPRPEVEFVYPIPEVAHPRLGALPGGRLEVGRGWVRGFLDLLFEHQGRVYVLDWKGDRLPGADAATLQARVEGTYRRQRQLYTLALARLLRITDPAGHQARFGGVVFAFLRAMRPEAPPPHGLVVSRPSWEALLEQERDLRDDTIWRTG